MPAYQTDIDIINRALQILRRPSIVRRTASSAEAKEMDDSYDKVREAELGRNLWRFATKRVILRVIETTTDLWTPAAYAAGTTYAVGNIVTYLNEWWQSKVASNLANTPALGNYWRRYYGIDNLQAYDADVSYFAGELVSSSGSYYLSLINDNEGNTPPSAGNWLSVGGSVVDLQILYPIGAGPAIDATTRNVYRLPRGFLRMAPPDPKAGAHAALGVLGGGYRADWVLEDNYLMTAQTPTLAIRYVADMIDVPEMPALFCEMLAASLAQNVGPVLLSKDELLPTLLRNARQVYRDARAAATRVDAIERGPVDMDMCDLVTVRF